MPISLIDPERQIEDARCVLCSLLACDDFAQHVYGRVLADAVSALEHIQDHRQDERTYSLAEVRDGTGWAPETRFTVVKPLP